MSLLKSNDPNDTECRHGRDVAVGCRQKRQEDCSNVTNDHITLELHHTAVGT